MWLCSFIMKCRFSIQSAINSSVQMSVYQNSLSKSVLSFFQCLNYNLENKSQRQFMYAEQCCFLWIYRGNKLQLFLKREISLKLIKIPTGLTNSMLQMQCTTTSQDLVQETKLDLVMQVSCYLDQSAQIFLVNNLGSQVYKKK